VGGFYDDFAQPLIHLRDTCFGSFSDPKGFQRKQFETTTATDSVVIG